jgi:hypothetical protein
MFTSDFVDRHIPCDPLFVLISCLFYVSSDFIYVVLLFDLPIAIDLAVDSEAQDKGLESFLKS